MPKVTAPLLSFGASGQLANTMVFSSWKGRPYTRRYVIPSNPNSSGQQLTRNTFTWVNGFWKNAPALARLPWTAYATGRPLTDRNAFVGLNTAALRSEVDLAEMIFSPGARGGVAPAAVSAAVGDTQTVVTMTAPSLPTGWTISRGIAIAVPDQDPQTEADFSIFAAEDATDPYAPTITGLTNGTLYQVGAFFEFNRPDGSLAYGTALKDTVTPTV